jgi:hypothetical protein
MSLAEDLRSHHGTVDTRTADELLGISECTVRSWIKLRILRAKPIQRRWIIDRFALADVVDMRNSAGAALKIDTMSRARGKNGRFLALTQESTETKDARVSP